MNEEKNQSITLDDLIEQSRTFKMEKADGSGYTEYKIVLPTSEEVKKAQWEYTKAYNKAMVEEVLTEGEMMDLLQRRGIVGDDFQRRLDELQKQVENKYIELELSEGKEEKRLIAIEISELREKIFSLNQRVSGPMSNTCESLAKDARNEYLTMTCTRTVDDKSIWNNLEEYIKEKDRNLAIKAKYEVMLWMEGIDTDFLENMPENVIIREMEEELQKEWDDKVAESVKEAEEAAAKAEKVREVVSESEVVEEAAEEAAEAPVAEKKPKKKSGRPKKKK